MPSTKPTVRTPASTVVAAVFRVTGEVPIATRTYALGTPEQQITIRLGDAVLYLHHAAVAHRINRRWQDGLFLAWQHLPRLLTPTALGAVPGTYPAAVAQRLTDLADLTVTWCPARPTSPVPPHLHAELGVLTWQVCDFLAWHRIGQAWSFAATQLASRR